MGAFRREEVSALGDIEMDWKGFNLASFFIIQGILTQSLFFFWNFIAFYAHQQAINITKKIRESS